MNISPHLLIDAGILSTALTITLVLRAKGNAARKERESKWKRLLVLLLGSLALPTGADTELDKENIRILFEGNRFRSLYRDNIARFNS